MAIVGSAHVVIRAITTRVQSDINAGFSGIRPTMARLGQQSGDSFRSGFHRARGADYRTMFRNAGRSAQGAGRDAGQMFGRLFDRVSNRIIQNGQRGAVARAGGQGGRLGDAFAAGFNRSGGSKMFSSSALRIAALAPIIGALVAALSSAISGLFAIGAAAASAAQSLVVLPGLLSAIVQAGAVLLGTFHGVGTALSAGLKAAQTQSTKSLDAIKKKSDSAARAVRDAIQGVKDAEENAAEGIQNATRGVADAKRSLADTYRSTAEATKNAARAVADAEDGLTEAHNNVRDAQEALTQARVDAKERLIDLQFAERGGAIAERRAAMELADARWQLNAASELPPDNRLRKEAQLAYDEARLNLDQIKESNGDNAEELKKVKKQGIDGMDEVVSAQDNLTKAQQGVRDAVQAVNDALRQQRQTAADNARSIADGQRGVADAERALSKAREDGADAIRKAKQALADARNAQADSTAEAKLGTTQQQAYATAMKNLSPAAQSFVKYLISLRDEMRGLREAGQEAMFPKLESAIQTLVGGLLPSLTRVMRRTGSAIGDVAMSIAGSMTSGPFVASFRRVTDQNAVSIRRMGAGFGDLLRVVLALMDAARPLVNRFTSWFQIWASNLRITTEAKNRTGQLTETFNRAGRRMEVIIDIVKNLTEGIFDVGSAAVPSGMKLLRAFRDATQSFADFTDTKAHRRRLQEFFGAVTTNFMALSSLIKVLGAAFLRLGESPAVAQIATALEPTVLKIEDLITSMLENSGGAIVEFINSIIDTFTELSKAGGLTIFLGILTGFFKTLNALLSTPVLGDGLKIMLSIGAAMFALSIIRKFPGISMLDRMMRSLWKTSGAGGRITTMLRNQMAGLGQAGRRAMDGIRLRMMYAREAAANAARTGFAKLKTAITDGAGAARRGLSALRTSAALHLANARAALRSRAATIRAAAADKAQTAVLKIKELWQRLTNRQMWANVASTIRARAVTIAKTIADRVAAAATKAWAAVQAVFNAIMSANPLGLIIVGVVALVAALVLAYKRFDWFREGVQAALHLVVGAFEWLIDGAKHLYDVLFGHSIFPDLLKGFRVIFSAIMAVVRFAVNVVMRVVHAWVGFFRNIIMPVIRGLLNVVRPVFTKIGQIVRTVWNGAIHPIMRMWTTYLRTVLIPIITWLWRNVVRPYFAAIGRAIAFAWNSVIRPAVRAFWGFINDTLIPILSRLWNDIIRPTWNNIGDKIRDIWNKFISPAFGAIKDFITDKLIPAFNKVKTGVTDMWRRIRSAAEAPVRFVVETIYNDGLRRALNFIPGVNLPEAHVNFAQGGVMPGYTPGRDVHKFFSPTGGRLDLSGGEAIMRPEFTRAVGGAVGVERLNRLARRGRIRHVEQGFASGGVFANPSSPVKIDGKYISRIAAAQLALAEQISKTNMYIMQGGYGGDHVAASGSSHNYPGVMDVGPASIYMERIMRTVGFAAWARNIAGRSQVGSGAHIHAVSLLDPKDAGSPQVYGSWANHGNGLSGYDNDPAPHYAWISNLQERLGAVNLKGIGGGSPGPDPRLVKAKDAKGSWLDAIGDMKAAFKVVTTGIRTMKERIVNNEWYSLVTSAVRNSAHSAVQYVNDKIPDSIHVPGPLPDLPFPDNPVPNPFDRGGVARGEGYMAKGVISPERVLSPRQTEAFERLVSYLDSRSGQTNERPVQLNVHVPHEASPRDVIDGLMYELKRYDRGGRYRR